MSASVAGAWDALRGGGDRSRPPVSVRVLHTPLVRALLILAIVALIAPVAARAASRPTAFAEVNRPAGVAVAGKRLIVAEASGGRLLSVSPFGFSTPLLDGLVPGVFTRGATGVAVDGKGTAYVAVADEGVIRFVTTAGRTGVYARGLGTPNGLAFDHDGNLYVADQAARRVLRIAPDRTVTTFASGFAHAPFGLALDPQGLLHVSTLADGRIWRVGSSAAPQEYATVKPSAEGLAFDADGVLYVGSQNAVRKIVEQEGLPPAAVTVASGFAGPLNLAFRGNELFVSAHGETFGDLANVVARAEVDVPGLPLAAPLLDATPLPDVPSHTVVHRAGAVALDPRPYLDVLPQATATDIGRDALEPTIGVTAKGNVFVSAAAFDATPGGVLARTKVMRSTDQGKSFSDASPGVTAVGAVHPPVTLDPYLYVDPRTSRVFITNLYVGCSYLAFSDDEGETWVPQPAACGVPGNDHQTIAAGPTAEKTLNYPNAVYYCYNVIAVYTNCSRSLDGGITFAQAGTPYPANWAPYAPLSGCAGNAGHVAVGPDGSVYLPIADCPTGPVIAISRDSAKTWTRVQVASGLGGAHHEAAVAADNAGNLYYLWVSGTDLLPYLSVSRDRGETWSAPRMVAPPGVTEANLPTLAAGDDGKIAVGFIATTSDCCYGSRVNARKTWNYYITVSTDAHAADPTFLSAPVNDPRDPVFRGFCDPDGRCGMVYDFIDMTIDAAGRPWLAGTDTCTAACARPGVSGKNNDGQGLVGQLVRGPRLVGSGTLQPPSWFTPTGASTR